MHYSLIPIPPEHLTVMAEGRVPGDWAPQVQARALPPAPVAARAMRLLADGCPELWACTFIIIRNEDLAIVGGCGFKGSPQDGRVEIGYGVSSSCRRQGIASAAVASLLKLAFDAGATEVLAEVLPENSASIGVVKKLGFCSLGLAVDAEGVTVTKWLAKRLTPA